MSADFTLSQNQYPGREPCVNSATRTNQRVREFCRKSRAPEVYLPDPERDRSETETSHIRSRISQTSSNTGENEITPRGPLSAFFVNWSVASVRRTDFSSPDRTRTYDKAINSRLLYQLSYRGILCTRRIRPVWRKYDYCRGRKLASKARRCKSILGVFSFVIASRI